MKVVVGTVPAIERRLIIDHPCMPDRSRELRKEQDRQASWDRLRTAPWSPLGLSRAFGSGQQRIQLVRLPSFSLPEFWEVCQRDPEWVLYSATVVDRDWCALTVKGYEPVEFDRGKLKEYFERLTSLTIPVAPDLSNMAGLDGTVTQLAIFGDMWSQVRYQWWSEHPPGWTALVGIVDEMLAAFSSHAAGE
jgi:hypothetical protein